MNNEEIKTTTEEVIPLGGEAAPQLEETKAPAPQQEEIAPIILSADESENKPQEKDGNPKKPNKFLKAVGTVLIILVAIILVLAIAAGALVYFATRDEMPSAPKDAPEKFAFSFDMVDINLFSENDPTIKLGEKDLDGILANVQKSINSQNSILTLDDLFTDITDDTVDLYARATVTKYGKSLTFPIKVVIDPQYSDPNVICYVKSIHCGKVSIFPNLLDLVMKNVKLPEYLSFQNGNIYYDATSLDPMIDKLIEDNLSSIGGLVSKFVNPDVTGISIEKEKLNINIEI